MIKFSNKDFILYIITGLSAIIDFRIALGIFLGYLINIIYKRLLILRVDYILKANKLNFLTYILNISGILILSLPILISLLFPNIFHWIGVLLALTYDKLYLYTNSFIGVNND